MSATLLATPPQASPANATPARGAQPRLARHWLLLFVSAILLVLGAVEDVYGNTDAGDVYGADAVQYMDVARAIGRHDWQSALNPLWSQGYPAMLAAARPLFPAGPLGDWRVTRTVNFAIFAADYLAFLWLISTLLAMPRKRKLTAGANESSTGQVLPWAVALALFVTTQMCLCQVSRVTPDELVNTCFFVAATLLVKLLDAAARRRLLLAGALGLLLGAAYIVKAVFLPLGCVVLLLLGLRLLQQRRPLAPALLATALFITIAGSYGAALSRSVGHTTFGESGSINYAWHVNRLQKWVHWEGGHQPASEAWPKAALARFAQWDAHPPDFGQPVHPSQIAQARPRVYSFAAPFHATYAPYYNPPYWYAGYRHFINPRYQLIALLKSATDLAATFATHLTLIAVTLLVAFSLRRRQTLRSLAAWLRTNWLLPALCLVGIAIYMPVHLEGRYLASFLALLPLTLLAVTAATLTANQQRAALLLVVAGVSADILRYEVPALKNLLHGKSPEANVEWKTGQALLAEHLAPGTRVGVLSWTANLASDWAFIGHVQIVSETATPEDVNLFWKLPAEEQLATLATFRRTGATALIAKGKPAGAGTPGWRQLGDTPMWIYNL